MANGKPRAYTNAIVSLGSTTRAVVRFTCISCTHELELANNDPRKHGSFFAQQARRRGWDTDGERLNRVFCPDCRKTPVGRSRREVELDSVVIQAMDIPPIIEGHAEAVVMLPAPREERPMARELSNDQRRHIRNLLDQYFDDKDGCYLVDDHGVAMSDQAIGSMAAVPWAEVTKIREASYGKILVDPAMAALRVQMAELEQQMAKMREALDGYGRKQVRAS